MRDSDSPEFDASEITYSSTRAQYHLAIDPERTSRPSLLLVYFIAHITEKPPRALPPLHSAIDVDSLDRWLSTHDPQSDTELTFTYAGHQLTLDTGGNLWAQPTNSTEENPNESHSE